MSGSGGDELPPCPLSPLQKGRGLSLLAAEDEAAGSEDCPSPLGDSNDGMIPSKVE